MLENVQIFWEGIWLEATVAIIIFLAFLLIRSIFTRYIFKLLLKLSKKTAVVLDDNILLSFERPLKAFFIFLGLYLALTVLPLTPAQDAFIARIFRSSLIILITWGLYNLTGVYSSLFFKIAKRMNLEIDNVLLPFLSTLAHFIIIALALSVLVDEWGYDISGIIAGLGLGGLAVALAAQDALSNIFGGMAIILDKPFSIGDWIYTPSVEGTVEDISFRSTRIRTFAHSLVTVPNSKLANEAITNWSRMGKRRVTFNLGVTYATTRAQLKSCVHQIKEMLENHADVHPDTIFVSFDKFSDSSLDIFLYFFTKTTNWAEFLAVKEDINFKIMEILEKEGVSVALPSTSLYFQNQLEAVNLQPKGTSPAKTDE